MRFEIRAGGCDSNSRRTRRVFRCVVFAFGIGRRLRHGAQNHTRSSASRERLSAAESSGPARSLRPHPRCRSASSRVASGCSCAGADACGADQTSLAPAIGKDTPAARPSPATVARLKPRPEAPAVNRPPPTTKTNPTKIPKRRPNPPAEVCIGSGFLARHRKPYNIQIDAVMDQERRGADDCAAARRSATTRNFMVADINGQTWWRVRVGPYPSPEEASAAQSRNFASSTSDSLHDLALIGAAAD